MMVRISRPIRQRKGTRRKRKEDPVVINLTRAVGLICLGFLLILIGVLLTLFGVSKRTEEGRVVSILIISPIMLVIGFLLCVWGFVWYAANYRLRMRQTETTYAPTPQSGFE